MKAAPFVEMLTDKIKPSYPRVCRLIPFLDSLSDGDVFRSVSEDAPTMNKKLAVLNIQGTAKGKDERAIHNDYLINLGVKGELFPEKATKGRAKRTIEREIGKT